MDNVERLMTLRNKKLGALLYNARLAARRSPENCAAVAGLSVEQYRAYESGAAAPSLPELESLAFYLDVPLDHFRGQTTLVQEDNVPDPEKSRRLHQLRDRVIGATLRQTRQNANLPIHELAGRVGIREDDLNQFELGQKSVPLPLLENLAEALSISVEALTDSTGPLRRRDEAHKIESAFRQLSPELQQFVTQPGNRAYLQLALKFSDLPAETLRSIGEDLLEITY
jgi:transcriptional regulator with XRE-family HTH domain